MINTELQKASEAYENSFTEYYRIWFANFSASSLVEHEQRLSRLLENDILYNSLLIDMAAELRELIHAECVRRGSMNGSREV